MYQSYYRPPLSAIENTYRRVERAVKWRRAARRRNGEGGAPSFSPHRIRGASKTRETKRATTARANLQALRRILRLSGHRPRFHGLRDLGSVFRCCGFIYRTNIIFGERTPGDNESNRGERQNWEPKLTGDHETNHWREAAPVARLTLISGHFSRRLEALCRFGRAKGMALARSK